MDIYICKSEAKLTPRIESSKNIEIIATIKSQECIILWDELKKKQTKKEAIMAVLKKYNDVTCHVYTLLEHLDDGSTKGSVKEKDSFIVLKGDYRL